MMLILGPKTREFMDALIRHDRSRNSRNASTGQDENSIESFFNYLYSYFFNPTQLALGENLGSQVSEVTSKREKSTAIVEENRTTAVILGATPTELVQVFSRNIGELNNPNKLRKIIAKARLNYSGRIRFLGLFVNPSESRQLSNNLPYRYPSTPSIQQALDMINGIEERVEQHLIDEMLSISKSAASEMEQKRRIEDSILLEINERIKNKEADYLVILSSQGETNTFTYVKTEEITKNMDPLCKLLARSTSPSIRFVSREQLALMTALNFTDPRINAQAMLSLLDKVRKSSKKPLDLVSAVRHTLEKTGLEPTEVPKQVRLFNNAFQTSLDNIPKSQKYGISAEEIKRLALALSQFIKKANLAKQITSSDISDVPLSTVPIEPNKSELKELELRVRQLTSEVQVTRDFKEVKKEIDRLKSDITAFEEKYNTIKTDWNTRLGHVLSALESRVPKNKSTDSRKTNTHESVSTSASTPDANIQRINNPIIGVSNNARKDEIKKPLKNKKTKMKKNQEREERKVSVEQVIKEITPTQNATTKNDETINPTIEIVAQAASEQKKRPNPLDLRSIDSSSGHTTPEAQTPSPQNNSTESSATTSHTGRRGLVPLDRYETNNHSLEQTTTQRAYETPKKVHFENQSPNSPVDPRKRNKELIIARLAEIDALAGQIIGLSGDEKLKNHKDIVYALGLQIRDRLDRFSKNLGDKEFSLFATDIREYINYTEKALEKEPGLWANFLRPIVNAMLSLINNIRVLCGVKKGYGLYQSTSDIWKEKGFGKKLRDRLMEGNNLHDAATFEEEERNKEEKRGPQPQ